MGDLITYETFLFYQARCREERSRREVCEERTRRLQALLGYEVDPIYEGED